MMAARLGCPVFVGRDRPRIALALLKRQPEVDVIISDDGLQHYALRRDIEIAVVDGERESGNGQLLPAGPLREPETRLSEVDIVVVNSGKTASLPLAESGAVPRFSMRLGNERFVMVQENARQHALEIEAKEFAQRIAGRNIHAVAGSAIRAVSSNICARSASRLPRIPFPTITRSSRASCACRRPK